MSGAAPEPWEGGGFEASGVLIIKEMLSSGSFVPVQFKSTRLLTT